MGGWAKDLAIVGDCSIYLSNSALVHNVGHHIKNETTSHQECWAGNRRVVKVVVVHHGKERWREFSF